jgi:hypothetical protein
VVFLAFSTINYSDSVVFLTFSYHESVLTIKSRAVKTRNYKVC